MERVATMKGVQWRLVVLLAIIVFALDQETKSLVVGAMGLYESTPLIPGFFSLTLTFNKGVAFGFLSALADPWRLLLLGLMTVGALAVVFYLLIKDYATDRFGQIALSLVIGGALGNVFDRVRFGYVIDFLDFFLGDYHYPAFNLADSSICIGALLIIIRWNRRPAA